MGLGRSVLFRVATSERLERAVKRVPGGELAAWRAASRYVAGRSRSGALATVEMLLERGHGVSVDLFGERVSDPAVADQVLEDYLALVAALPPPPADVWLSVDLSHLALAAGAAAAADRLAAIADALPVGRRVQVGAEEGALTDAVQACVVAVAAGGLADRLGATVQANLVRSRADTDALADAGVHVRLVKGAYVEATGAHRYGEPTDVAFLRLGFGLAERGAAWPPASTSPTAPTGSATGCAGSPSPAAPDSRTARPPCRRRIRSRDNHAPGVERMRASAPTPARRLHGTNCERVASRAWTTVSPDKASTNRLAA